MRYCPSVHVTMKDLHIKRIFLGVGNGITVYSTTPFQWGLKGSERIHWSISRNYLALTAASLFVIFIPKITKFADSQQCCSQPLFRFSPTVHWLSLEFGFYCHSNFNGCAISSLLFVVIVIIVTTTTRHNTSEFVHPFAQTTQNGWTDWLTAVNLWQQILMWTQNVKAVKARKQKPKTFP